ncbi:MAG: hypothetical protein GF411_20335 [Candidatus Lokiarchaeota archaeon]|nr:hypothetical protein [Candidatus Lokiarchaeota archaeon]
MDVVYKKWKEGEGLEEAQALIYTEASGLPAQADQIGPRNVSRGPDLTRYALTKDGKPLAYVTSFTNFGEKEALIGYPWAMPDCPEEVQEKLFNEQLEYLESLDDIDTLMTAVVSRSKIRDDQIEWFESRGFRREDSIYQYLLDVDVSKAAKIEITGKSAQLTARKATDDDIDKLVELSLADERLRSAFQNEEGFKTYFKERVFPLQAPLLVFDGDTLVAATAPLKFEPDGNIVRGNDPRIIMRFQAIRPGYTYAWDRLFTEFAKYCEELGWNDIPIQTGFGFTSNEGQPIGLARVIPNLEEYEVRLFKR